MAHFIEVLDKTLTPITRVAAPMPLDNHGVWLKYGKRLSDVGTCSFRVATRDPLWTTYGDILQPWANHIRLYEDNAIVWQGVVIDAPKRNAQHIDVVAKTYLCYLGKKRINQDASITAGDGLENYRTLKTGTMATAITAFLNEAKAGANGNLLAGMTIGTIENPNFPNGFTKIDGSALTGPWTFSTDLTLQFSYVSYLKMLQQLAIYSNCDYEMAYTPVNGLTFNWRVFLGNKHPELVFEYGATGSIADFDAPLHGSKMVNDLMGIGAAPDGTILHISKQLAASVSQYGSLEDVAGFNDVKDKNALTSRIVQELPFSAYPNAELELILNNRAYPLGLYDIGDTITAKIKIGPINVNQVRRIIGYDVLINTVGDKTISLLTNIPKDN